MDIANLGLAVDSRPVDAAVVSLDKFSRSSRTAQQSASSFTGSVRPMAVDMGALDRAVMSAAADLNVHSVALRNNTAASHMAGAGFKGLSFEARNLGFQLVDVTQGAIMGQSAFMILAQQGGQLAQVFAFAPNGAGGLFRELGKTFAGLLTPMRLLGVGAIAVAAGVYAMNASWKASTKQLDDVAKAANATIGEIRALERAASLKGIESSELLQASTDLASHIYDARNGMGSLGTLLRANGEQATSFAGTLESVARIIGRAGSAQEKLKLLQQAGLPATMQWVKFLSQGADGIREVFGEANKTSAAQQQMIDKAREFDESWDRAWKNFKSNAVDAFTAIKAGFQDLSFIGDAINDWAVRSGAISQGTINRNALNSSRATDTQTTDYNQFYDRVGAGTRPRVMVGAVDPNAAREAISRDMQRISILGQMASVEQQVLLVEKQIQQARLAGINISDREELALTSIARERALGIDSLRQQAESYRIEADTLGMTTGQAVAYETVQNRINEAKRNGQVLREEEIALIRREAEALGNSAQRTEDLRFGYDTFRGSLQTVRSELANGASVMEAFEKAGLRALDRISEKLMDMAAQQLWQAAFPGGGSGGGGFLGAIGSFVGSLFGGGGGGAPGGAAVAAANGRVFDGPGISAYSNQIVSRPTVFPMARGAGLMGEAGPEAVMPLRRDSGGRLGVVASGGGGTTVEFNIAMDLSNAQRGVGEEVTSTLKAFVNSDAFKAKVQEAVDEGKSRRRAA